MKTTTQTPRAIGSHTYSEINLNFIIKVFQNWNGVKINKAVGCDGLINLVGMQTAEKLVARAFAGTGDCTRCKVYGGAQVSFYLH